MIYFILIIILQLSNVILSPPLVEYEFLKKTIEGSKTDSIENVKTKVSVTKVFVTLAEGCYRYRKKRSFGRQTEIQVL